MGNYAAPIPRKPRRSVARASWCSGRGATLPNGDEIVWKGWFIDAEIDDEIDAAAHAAGWRLGTIVHQRGEATPNWLVPDPAKVFALIADMPVYDDGEPLRTVSELARVDVSAYGIMARWPQGGLSGLSFRGLPYDLLAHGCTRAIPFATTSNNTDNLLAALLHHAEIVQYARQLEENAGRAPTTDFFTLAMMTKAGTMIERGKGEQKAQVYPLLDAHPAAATREYLGSLKPPKGVDLRAIFEYYFFGPQSDSDEAVPELFETIPQWAKRVATEQFETQGKPQRKETFHER